MQSTQAQDIVRKAVAAFNSGRHQDAQKLCEQGLARQPLEPTLNHLLAAMLFKPSEFSSARQRISTSLTVNRSNPAALLLADRIARWGKDFEAALSYLKRAAALRRQSGGAARDQPSSSSMVQKLLNLSAACPSRAKGAPGNWLATRKLSSARGCPDVAGFAISQFHENAPPQSIDTSHGSRIMKP